MQTHFYRVLRNWRWLALFVACCGLSCTHDSGLHPVQGKVFYKDQPLGGVLVTFHPKGASDIHTVRPVGLTREDGTFTLTTGQQEGAPAGEYVVTFLCSETVVPKGGAKVISSAPRGRNARTTSSRSAWPATTITTSGSPFRPGLTTSAPPPRATRWAPRRKGTPRRP